MSRAVVKAVKVDPAKEREAKEREREALRLQRLAKQDASDAAAAAAAAAELLMKQKQQRDRDRRAKNAAQRRATPVPPPPPQAEEPVEPILLESKSAPSFSQHVDSLREKENAVSRCPFFFTSPKARRKKLAELENEDLGPAPPQPKKNPNRSKFKSVDQWAES